MTTVTSANAAGPSASIAIENPVLNSPFEVPERHWQIDDDGNVTGTILSGRRRSVYSPPSRRPKARPSSRLSSTTGRT